jgi:hypothetical protein
VAKNRPTPAKKPKTRDDWGVVLAGPNPGVVDAYFMGSVSALLIHDANRRQAVTRWGGCIWLESSPRIYAARCEIVSKFLEDTGGWPKPPEWLLFIDADMTFDDTAVDQMLETVEKNPEIKILGGLCFAGGRGKQAFPTIYTVRNPEEFDPSKPLLLDKHMEYPKDKLIKVNATGGAFIMIHREVLEAMRDANPDDPFPWFREYVQAGVPFGEDIYFGLRAGSLGFSTWVNTAIKVGHRKTYTLDEKYYEDRFDDYVEAMNEGRPGRETL